MEHKQFQRDFYNSDGFSVIGGGEIGGKASGLVALKKIIKTSINTEKYLSAIIKVPTFVVLGSKCFDRFMESNKLYDLVFEDVPDDKIAMEFQRASFPPELIGDIRSIATSVKLPLAVRSSSLLEDKKYEPFAGIYATKMISNNHIQAQTRFDKLVQAIKYVYASTYFKSAKNYIKVTSNEIADEKMSVVIQEVAGTKFDDLFYPEISGVSRSFNFYPTSRAKPQDGVSSLALGLGKTIVDGGVCWNYSPSYPKIQPPFSKISDLLKNTQLKFWAINLKDMDAYNPISEVEYLHEEELCRAEEDGNLKLIASTYNSASDRIVLGIGNDGPRIINFGPLLQFNEYQYNQVTKDILDICSQEAKQPVELEFTVTFNDSKMNFNLLQMRPMVVSDENIVIENEELFSDNSIVSSGHALGNGQLENINDIVFVDPNKFDKKYTNQIANEIEVLNRKLINRNTKYLLIGFGRWGSSDPWLGIPVDWSQISGAKVIVESTLPEMNVDLSQGSHFFHNLTSFKVFYFSVSFNSQHIINWNWIGEQPVHEKLKFVSHIKLDKPLTIKVDGKKGIGVVKK